MRLKANVSLLVFLCSLLQACNQAEQPAPVATTKEFAENSVTKAHQQVPEIEIENISPDQAVKTWWKYLDLTERIDAEECKVRENTPPPQHLALLPQITAGDLLKTKTAIIVTCEATVYERDIDEVKTESETRALVFTTIKNVTPIPEGATLDAIDNEWRKDGFKFRYLVEKTGGTWKISQVYKYQDVNKYLKKDVWEKQYIPKDKPSVSSGVWLH